MKPVPAPCGTSLPPWVGAPRPRGPPWTMLRISTVAGRTFAATPATSGKPPAPPCEAGAVAGAVACAPPAPDCGVTAVAAAAKGPLLAVRAAVGGALVAVASAVALPAPELVLSVRLQAARDSPRTRVRTSAGAGAGLR